MKSKSRRSRNSEAERWVEGALGSSLKWKSIHRSSISNRLPQQAWWASVSEEITAVIGSATLLSKGPYPEICFHSWRLCHSQSSLLLVRLSSQHHAKATAGPSPSINSNRPFHVDSETAKHNRDVRKSRMKIMTTERFKKSWNVMLVIQEDFVKYVNFLFYQFIISRNHLCTRWEPCM